LSHQKLRSERIRKRYGRLPADIDEHGRAASAYLYRICMSLANPGEGPGL
jgi:hypothetical protein